MGRLVYGYWDCPNCKSKGIRGDIRECPNCGNPRGSDTKFYMGQNIQYVPSDKASTINRNPDWLCSYCNALNSADLQECKGCGASKTESDKNYFDLHKNDNQPDKTQPVNHSMTQNQNDNQNTPRNRDFTALAAPVIKAGIFAAIAAILIFLCLFIFATRSEEMTVSGFSWVRTIEIEKLITVDESGWNLPSGARLQYSKEEFKEYQNVLDHYETKTREVTKQRISGYEEYISGYRDLGNGMFEEITAERPIYETYYETETYQEPIYRQEAIYATKYYYEIDKWVKSRIVKTSGSDKNPVWGEVNLASKERMSTKNEIYTIHFYSRDSTSYSFDTSFSIWNSLSQGDTIEAEVSRWGSIAKITVPENK